jgi:hypothetical protein
LVPTILFAIEKQFAKLLMLPKVTLSYAGLPDGLLSNQESQFGSILEGLRLANVDIFYGQLDYF